MEFLILGSFVLLFGGSASAALYLGVRKRRERVEAWCVAARAAGLEDVAVERSSWLSAQVTGRKGGHRVRFEEYAPDKNERGTRVVIDCGSAITLRQETFSTAWGKTMRGDREIQIGDDAFDREVYVRGAPVVLRAVLDRETRWLVRGLLQGHVRGVGGVRTGNISILDGELRWEFREDRTELLQVELPRALDGLLDIARRLARPRDVPQRLADNLRHEPEWGARLGIVLAMAGGFPNHPATRDALAHACEDERGEVQLQAALALGGEKGRSTLLEIASRESSDDASASRAVFALTEHVPRELLLTILGSALRTRRTETARACLERLGRLGGPAVVPLLAKVLAVETGDLALSAAAALGQSGAATAEPPLLDALRNETSEIRVGAAEALGRVGSVSAVMPLQEAAARHRFDGELRRATRQAIAEIQSRVSGASPGQLSLAEGDAGRLSLADEDPAGRVSIADPGESE